MTPDLITSLRSAVSQHGQTSSDFDLNPEVSLPLGRQLRDAAVLIAIQEGPHGPSVLLTKRSSQLKHHPGQIAFPGGKVDPQDANVTETALREAYEEVGLPSDHVTIIGALPYHETVTGFKVTPIVATIDRHFDIVPEAGEVEEVFTVPLAHVLNTDNYIIEGRLWRGQTRHFFTVPYGPYYIWGATARILRAFADTFPQ